jgi:hypothetical protein
MDFGDKDFRFVQDDPDVLMRITSDDGSEEVVFLTTDKDTMDGKLFNVQQGAKGQWFVVVNQRMLDEKIEKSVEANAEEYGKKHAMFLPISYIIQEAMSEVMHRYEEEQQ